MSSISSRPFATDSKAFSKSKNSYYATSEKQEIIYLFSNCPGITFVKIMLGNPVGKNFTLIPRYSLWYGIPRYLILTFLLVMLLIDMCDWILNQESNPLDTLDTEGLQQSRIITILAYMSTQCVFVSSFCICAVFVHKSGNILRLSNSIINVSQMFDVKLSRPKRSAAIKRFIIGCSAMCVVASVRTFQFLYKVYLICKADHMSTWTLTNYFIWQVPKFYAQSYLGISILFSNLIPIPLYLFYMFVCSISTECGSKYNKTLKQLIHVLRTEFLQSQVHLNTMIDLTKLRQLSEIDRVLRELLLEVNDSFSVFLLASILGNAMIVCSLGASFFIPGLIGPSTVPHLMFLINIGLPVITLIMVLAFAIFLNQNNSKSAGLWRDLVLSRNLCSDRLVLLGEGEIKTLFITLLHCVSGQENNLRVAGGAQVTSSFGIKLLTGFVAFLCFLIERSERRHPLDQSAGMKNQTDSLACLLCSHLNCTL